MTGGYQVKVQLYRNSNETGIINVLNKGARTRMIQLPEGLWTPAMESWDEKGYTYRNPFTGKWDFIKIIEGVRNRPLGDVTKGKRPMSKRDRIMIGIAFEHTLARLLRPRLEPLFVYNLPMSGAHSGGTDIVISRVKEDDIDTDPLRIVDRGLLAVSLLTYSKTRAGFQLQPGFHNWAKTTKNPVISWHIGEEYFFVFLDEDKYKAIFIKEDGSIKKYRANSRPAEPYKLDIDSFTKVITGEVI